MITPTQFKIAKPQFDDVSDQTVQIYLDLSGIWVDESWPTNLRDTAQISIACHLMTLDGLGTDTESREQATGAAQYQSIRSGELTLSRYQRSAGSMSYGDWLAQTKCGSFFLQLLRMAKAGPRVAMGGSFGGLSGYAKDWPAGTGGYKDGPLE